MKHIKLLVMLLLYNVTGQSTPSQGYKLMLQMPDVKDSIVFLAHYYGAALPKIYLRDSARFDSNGVAEFYSTDTSFVAGIYLLLLSDRKTYFEILLNKGDDMHITAQRSKLPDSIIFKNSPENDRFQKCCAFMRDISSVRDSVGRAKEIDSFRRDYSYRYPNTLLANIFNALVGSASNEPGHYWDGFDFNDDRLIHTPILKSKLDQYFNKIVLQNPDAIEQEVDMILEKMKDSKNLFKFTLWWITRNVENSRVVGMDEVFEYLVVHYYEAGKAPWLADEELLKYHSVNGYSPRWHRYLIGNTIQGLKLRSVTKGDDIHIDSLSSGYLLLVFYSPLNTKSQDEMRSLVTLYNASLKDKNVKIVTIATQGDERVVKEFISKNKMSGWVNALDTANVMYYKQSFDVNDSTTICLLDRHMTLIGKRVDHTNIEMVIATTERKAKKRH